MGLWSGIVDFVGGCVNAVADVFFPTPKIPQIPASNSGVSGGTTTHTITTTNHNTTTTTYDPDRVKAAQLDKERAEIESSSQIRLAGMEKERIELMRRAQLDIIEAQTQSKLLQERARAEGLVKIAEAITAMQEKLNDLAEQRLAIIERGTLQAVRDAENFYTELETTIQDEQEKYMTKKLPALFEILGKYEAGSSAHTLYLATIQNDVALQINHTTQQLESARVRREKMIESIHETKREITCHTENITAGILDTVNKKLSEIDTGNNIQLQSVKEIPALTA